MTARRPNVHPDWMPALVLAVALAILGAAILAGYRQLRELARQQLINRDGEVLYAVAQARQMGQVGTNLAHRLEIPAEQFLLALELSQLKEDILGVRLFDRSGRLVAALPPNVADARLAPEIAARLAQRAPVTSFHPRAALDDYFLMDPASTQSPSNTLPMLEVNLPIHAGPEGPVLASAQMLMDGRKIAAQAAAFDDRLRLGSLAVFLGAGLLLTAVLAWAYRRLAMANLLLQERTDHLLRANHELTLAAKTGALGSVTAHLIHGLSNPLANLLDFMSARSGSHAGDAEWEDAAAATRRMQGLVHEVVRVLSESTTQDDYELTFGELARVLEGKLAPAVARFGVRWEGRVLAEGRLSNHRANVVLLILENLASNALQVSPKGGSVRLEIRAEGGRIVCEVADEGPGFPPAVLKNLFTPCRSTKGGAGLGLAISKQLAGQLGGALELRRNQGGAVMALVLPGPDSTPVAPRVPDVA